MTFYTGTHTSHFTDTVAQLVCILGTDRGLLNTHTLCDTDHVHTHTHTYDRGHRHHAVHITHTSLSHRGI